MSDLFAQIASAWMQAYDEDSIFVCDLPKDLIYRRDGGVDVFCNDLFWWGCADSEDITIQNVDVYAKAISDMRAALPRSNEKERDASEKHVLDWAGTLFAARVRQLQPQFACYPGVGTPEGAIISGLLDAVGPMRPTDMGNPYRHPKDGGGYGYERAMDQDPSIAAFWDDYKIRVGAK